MKGTSENRLAILPRARLALLPPPSAEPIAWPVLSGQVMIAFTSRVGSTFLCRHIEKTRAASHIVEAFNLKGLEVVKARYDLASIESAVAWRMARSIEAGWFVVKAGVPGLPTAEHIGHMARYGAVTRFLFVLRRDVVAQAVSIGTAVRSGQFHSNQQASAIVSADDYDADALTNMILAILQGNQTLERYLVAAGRGAHVLYYEDFADGDFTTVDAALDRIGLPRRAEPPARALAEVHRVTRDVSAEWIVRLRQADGVADLVRKHERLLARVEKRFG